MKDFTWALWLALPFGGATLWRIAKHLPLTTAAQVTLTIGGSLGVGYGLLVLHDSAPKQVAQTQIVNTTPSSDKPLTQKQVEELFNKYFPRSPESPRHHAKGTKVFDSTPSAEQARVRIARIQFVPVSAGVEAYPFFNIDFDNAGKLPATGILKRFAPFASEKVLSTAEALAKQDALQLTGPSPMDDNNELYPGVTKFFSYPNKPGQEAAAMPLMVSLVNAKLMVFYLFMAFRYKDRSMPTDVMGITESCALFYETFDTYHDCGRQRSYLAKITNPVTPSVNNKK